MRKIPKEMGRPFILMCLLIFTAVMPLYADRLEVYDRDSNVKYSVSVLESEEVSGQTYVIDAPNLADPSKWGSYSLVIEASSGKISDVFGVANDGNNFYLAFISYTEPVPADYWSPAGPVYIENTAGPFDATIYLHPNLLAQGHTAAFYSDHPAGEIPEPATMLLLGSGLLGLAGLRKKFKK